MADGRPTFATPLASLPGLTNVARVAPGIYRGSAPGAKGLDSLRKLGIRTVVNLRHYHGVREAQACRGRGIDYVRIALASRDAPRDRDVRRFLELVADPARHPVYFHCWRGKDRTGVMCAAYRIVCCGWGVDEALSEMKAFGFFHGWRRLRAYAESLTQPRDRFEADR